MALPSVVVLLLLLLSGFGSGTVQVQVDLAHAAVDHGHRGFPKVGPAIIPRRGFPIQLKWPADHAIL
jgi:hypothetical protein